MRKWGDKMVKQPYIKSLFPIVITIVAIGLISITGCAKQGPFIPEYVVPPDGGYIEITFIQIDDVLFSHNIEPAAAMRQWQGKRLIVKNITVNEFALSTLKEDHIYFNNLKCIPQKPADLLKLKEGDVIDLIGVFVDIPLAAGRNIGVVVLASCQFLPADVYPLPLSGGTAPPIGY